MPGMVSVCVPSKYFLSIFCLRSQESVSSDVLQVAVSIILLDYLIRVCPLHSMCMLLLAAWQCQVESVSVWSLLWFNFFSSSLVICWKLQLHLVFLVQSQLAFAGICQLLWKCNPEIQQHNKFEAQESLVTIPVLRRMVTVLKSVRCPAHLPIGLFALAGSVLCGFACTCEPQIREWSHFVLSSVCDLLCLHASVRFAAMALKCLSFPELNRAGHAAWYLCLSTCSELVIFFLTGQFVLVCHRWSCRCATEDNALWCWK